MKYVGMRDSLPTRVRVVWKFGLLRANLVVVSAFFVLEGGERQLTSERSKNEGDDSTVSMVYTMCVEHDERFTTGVLKLKLLPVCI